MSGQWPPDWEDSDTGLPDEWSVDAGLGPEASQVPLFLASVPTPGLPASFEARISAAIAAEASARATGTASAETASAEADSAGIASAGIASAEADSAGIASAEADSAGITSAGPESARIASAGPEPADAGITAAESADAETTDRSSPHEFAHSAAESGAATAAKRRRRRTSAVSRGSAARGSRPTGSRPGGRRRRFRMPAPAATGPLLVLLVIAGFALVLSQFSSSSSSSSSEFAGGTASSASPAGAHSAANGRYQGSRPQYETSPGQNAYKNFVVTDSGTEYRGATLASQVREQLDALSHSAVTPSASSVPGVASSASPYSLAVPNTQLAGCVSRLTGNVTPALVDRASYNGTPAYIIAVPSRVWVVRVGCSAADPQEITSESLAG